MLPTSEPLIVLTAKLTVAYLRANQVASAAVPGLIQSIHGSLSELETGAHGERRLAHAERKLPGAPGESVRKSLFPDHLVCLEDGRKMTMLKRHLNTDHKMTPQQYRAKWDLPADYPMVAPNYSKLRSRLAKEGGLGKARLS
jgi:predicted transcriptional regulator